MPQRLGRYLLLEKIGQGGMAEVFAARLEGPAMFARTCVIKRLRPELAKIPQQVTLFLEEARLSAMLQHPCVVQVFDVGEGDDGQVFFAMERVDGPPLSRVLQVLQQSGDLLPPTVAAWIGARAAEGLHFAHELFDKSTGKPLHIAHRDVSPHNILLGTTGDVKVADFGIAKADVEHRPQTRFGVTKGKLAYMSPEQARGERVDRRTDVYALGVVLWEMLAGQPLIEDRAQRKRLEQGAVMPPSMVRAGIDVALDNVVLAALAPLPKDRTPTCRAMEEALDHWLQDRGASPRQELQELLRDRAGEILAGGEITNTTPQRQSPPFARVSPDAKTVVKSVSSGASGFDLDEATRPQLDLAELAVPNTSPDGAAHSGDTPGPAARGALDTDDLGAPAALAAPVAVKAGRGAVPVPSVPEAPRLPHASTSFVGRKRDLLEIGAAFDEGARLVTLLGPGGTGKTRLALRFAEQHGGRAASAFPGGVWFADLTGARDDAAAQAIVARALGVPLRAGRSPVESQVMLGHALGALGRSLIVLDGCDDVARGGAEVIADLLRRCPRARFLATSQQVLGVAGERALDVLPLPVPREGVDHRGAGTNGDGNGDEGAVELFLERARAARNGHALSASARGVVSEIVRRLDGVPLAIELAAARAATENPSEILQRLGKSGDGRTLKAAIGETYAQLADDEKRAFRQAAVFRGGFDLDAADAVFELGDDAPRAADVLERLKGRSLIVARGGRYTMLEALRGFATERLEEAQEKSATEARHAGYTVALGKKLAHALDDPRASSDIAERIALEIENLTVVVERAGQSARPSTAAVSMALEAALALEPVLAQRASAAQQLALLDKALALAEGRGVTESLRMRGHLARAEARRLLGAFDQARADLHAAIDLAHGDVAAEARAQASLGALALAQGRLDLAEDTLVRALGLVAPAELARQGGQAVAVEVDLARASDDVAAGRVIAQLGKVSRLRRRLGEAEQRGRRAVELSSAAGDKRAAGRALVELASTLLASQKLVDADSAAHDAIDALSALNDRRSLVHAWGTLSIIEVDRSRWEEAENAAAHAVDLAVRVGERKAFGLYSGIRAAALHGRGSLIDAREHYAQASRALFESGDDGAGAFFLAALGAVQAALDDIDGAAKSFATAQRRTRTAERPHLELTVKLFEGLLLLARAGDQESRAAARDELRARLSTAMSPSSLGAPFDRSEEVRFAARVARAAVG